MSAKDGAVRAALVGCGNVSRQYLSTFQGDERIQVVCCSDLDASRAENVSSEFGIPRILTLQDILVDPDVELVLNLTAPVAHASVTMQALNKGKNVYSEKTLAVTVDDARSIIDLAAAQNLLVGCAPDTFLGNGIQETKALLESGVIGQPFMVQMARIGLGPERFHPAPDFLFQEGVGPLFDIGPYLVTALTYLLGPIEAVTTVFSNPAPRRTLVVGERAGEVITSEIPTSLVATLEFTSGAIGTLAQSWDVAGTHAPPLEIHGTKGSILGTPPNSWFGSPSLKLIGEDGDFAEKTAPVGSETLPQGMGMGALQMCEAIRSGTAPMASASRALHTLEVLTAIHESGDTQTRVTIDGTHE